MLYKLRNTNRVDIYFQRNISCGSIIYNHASRQYVYRPPAKLPDHDEWGMTTTSLAMISAKITELNNTSLSQEKRYELNSEIVARWNRHER